MRTCALLQDHGRLRWPVCGHMLVWVDGCMSVRALHSPSTIDVDFGFFWSNAKICFPNIKSIINNQTDLSVINALFAGDSSLASVASAGGNSDIRKRADLTWQNMELSAGFEGVSFLMCRLHGSRRQRNVIPGSPAGRSAGTFDGKNFFTSTEIYYCYKKYTEKVGEKPIFTLVRAEPTAHP